MSEELHKCKGCDRKIPAHIIYCLICRSKLVKQGLCGWCGEKPRAPKTSGQQSKYCVDCKQRMADNREKWQALQSKLPPQPVAKSRGPDARENVWETKHGRD